MSEPNLTSVQPAGTGWTTRLTDGRKFEIQVVGIHGRLRLTLASENGSSVPTVLHLDAGEARLIGKALRTFAGPGPAARACGCCSGTLSAHTPDCCRPAEFDLSSAAAALLDGKTPRQYAQDPCEHGMRYRGTGRSCGYCLALAEIAEGCALPSEGDTVAETLVDGTALVAELRRQVNDRRPEDDTRPWAVAFLNLADSLEAGWMRPQGQSRAAAS